jgi:hypothetical protein
MEIQIQTLINSVISRFEKISEHTHMKDAVAEQFVWMFGLKGCVSFRYSSDLLAEIKSGGRDTEIEDALWLLEDAAKSS